MDTTVLEEIGLKKDEIKVYFALLKLSSVTATKIAIETNILRTNTYWILDSLIHRGLVSYVIKNNVKYFTAAKPARILEIEQEKQQKIQALIPEIEKLSDLKKEEIKVELFRDIEGLKTAYRYILKEKQPCKVFGDHSTSIVKLFPSFFDQLLRDFKVYNIKEKIVTKEWRRENVLSAETTEVKYVPNDFPLPEAYTVISGDLVVTFNCEEPYYAVMIKSANNAKLNSRHFDQLWKLAKK